MMVQTKTSEYGMSAVHVDGLLSWTRLTRSTRSLDELWVSWIGLVKTRLALRVVPLHRSVRSKYGLVTSLTDKEANVSC